MANPASGGLTTEERREQCAAQSATICAYRTQSPPKYRGAALCRAPSRISRSVLNRPMQVSGIADGDGAETGALDDVDGLGSIGEGMTVGVGMLTEDIDEGVAGAGMGLPDNLDVIQFDLEDWVTGGIQLAKCGYGDDKRRSSIRDSDVTSHPGPI
ncbi:hypothetical protein P153DRAFT_417059 [Dothidotthia symphoricarpi CBS 119687]|uniref:Uncharacterized protein n=1 Tax=Dothidotthia symphoricarpi CBS 119687 TaxID=1392245 RepID=A0A6A6AH29_9PLEO|nr:uncharacterized protein P153DRAFT_417059 [Dothidotthia symphoricarpi CBS 119687]KAF2130866.1 hypothetical protein P153DRAFT_417059 [Dothidotthia symphoricarpi CBS 119687]